MPSSLLVVGIFRQVTGSISKPLEDTRTLLRFLMGYAGLRRPTYFIAQGQRPSTTA